VGTRIASAAVLLPLVVGAAVLGNPWWGLGATGIALLALREQTDLARARGLRPAAPIAYPLAAALALSGFLPGLDLVRPALAGAVVAAYAWQIARPPAERSLADWTATLAFPAGVGILAGYLVLLRGRPDGLAWTMLLLTMVWANDSAAYLAGRTFGRTPFFASISPKKTREGALGGLLAVVAVGLLAPTAGAAVPALLGPLAAVSPMALAALGLAVAVVAPAGDLSQSYLKRQAGAKDSGRLIPGHGGILDRVDSLAFAAPVVWYAALLLAGGAP